MGGGWSLGSRGDAGQTPFIANRIKIHITTYFLHLFFFLKRCAFTSPHSAFVSWLVDCIDRLRPFAEGDDSSRREGRRRAPSLRYRRPTPVRSGAKSAPIDDLNWPGWKSIFIFGRRSPAPMILPGPVKQRQRSRNDHLRTNTWGLYENA